MEDNGTKGTKLLRRPCRYRKPFGFINKNNLAEHLKWPIYYLRYENLLTLI
jgi:hypothetical protein